MMVPAWDNPVTSWISSQAGKILQNIAGSISEAVGKVVSSLGTLWVGIQTPTLTGGEQTSAVAAGHAGAASSGVTTVLGYVMWVSLAVAVLALMFAGVQVGAGRRRGDGIAVSGKVLAVLGGAVLIAASSSIVAGMMPSAQGSGPVFFLQSALWWYTGAAAIASVIVGGAAMAWQGRAQPGIETVKSLLTLIVVSGAGVTVVNLLTKAADGFAVDILNGSLSCSVQSGSCFADNMTSLLAMSVLTGNGLPVMLLIILGLIALLVSLIQVAMMIVRGGMLVILCGVLPLSASMTNTQFGRDWFKKSIGWLVAFILYKPAAAIVYAAAFQLAGQKVFSDDGTGIISVVAGLILMIIALVAMPALMRFVTPLVGAAAGSGAVGTAVLAGAAAALPTGAAKAGQLLRGSGGGAAQTGAAQTGAAGKGGRAGNTGAPGGAGSGGATGAGGAAGGAGTAGAAGSAGAAGGAGAAGAAGAAGPAGVAVAAGAGVAKGAAGAARGAAEGATGESASGGSMGPSGASSGGAPTQRNQTMNDAQNGSGPSGSE